MASCFHLLDVTYFVALLAEKKKFLRQKDLPQRQI